MLITLYLSLFSDDLDQRITARLDSVARVCSENIYFSLLFWNIPRISQFDNILFLSLFSDDLDKRMAAWLDSVAQGCSEKTCFSLLFWYIPRISQFDNILFLSLFSDDLDQRMTVWLDSVAQGCSEDTRFSLLSSALDAFLERFEQGASSFSWSSSWYQISFLMFYICLK